jgi:hypothetical protein
MVPRCTAACGQHNNYLLQVAFVHYLCTVTKTHLHCSHSNTLQFRNKTVCPFFTRVESTVAQGIDVLVCLLHVHD